MMMTFFTCRVPPCASCWPCRASPPGGPPRWRDTPRPLVDALVVDGVLRERHAEVREHLRDRPLPALERVRHADATVRVARQRQTGHGGLQPFDLVHSVEMPERV